jgi:Lon protease-like protein
VDLLGGLVSPLLPLFPLEVVLFPGVPLPLHIFEPRYKEMIGECLSQEKRFGVVRAQESGVAEIGCTAEIMAVTKKYDDGRMDIVTEGRERFEVLEVNQERDFLRADVLFFEDDPEKATPEEIAHAIKLHGEIMALIGAQPTLSGDDNPRLSFGLAGSLPLDLDFKQNLLSMRSEPKRMQAVTAYFEAILPKLRRAVHVRKKASGNGHAR